MAPAWRDGKWTRCGFSSEEHWRLAPFGHPYQPRPTLREWLRKRIPWLALVIAGCAMLGNRRFR